MFSLQMDAQVDHVIEKMTKLASDISGAGDEILESFRDWQRFDMNRRWPKTSQESALSFYTMIYPRSRLSMTRARSRAIALRFAEQRRRQRRRPTPMRRYAGRRFKPGQKRPILRPELREIFTLRMLQMADRVIRWS